MPLTVILSVKYNENQLERKNVLFRFIPIHKVLFTLRCLNNIFWCGLRILLIRSWRKRSHFYCNILLSWVLQIELSSFAKLTSSAPEFFSYLKRQNSTEKFSSSTQARITLKMSLQLVEGMVFCDYLIRLKIFLIAFIFCKMPTIDSANKNHLYG